MTTGTVWTARLQSFFDLGNSLRRGDSGCIGEKGHGTKVYLNSSQIAVYTRREGKLLTAVVDEPFARLFNREIPIVKVSETDWAEAGTRHADYFCWDITTAGENSSLTLDLLIMFAGSQKWAQ